MSAEIPQQKPDRQARPKSVCVSCGEILHLKWGQIRRPHWSHGPRSTCKSPTAGETAFHKLSKDKLVEFLTNGGKLNFRSPCYHCGKHTNRSLPATARKFTQEQPYSFEGDMVIFDVGCLDEKDELVFAIEVFHSHKAAKLNIRNKVDWVEVKSQDVVARFIPESDIGDETLCLLDTRQDFLCGGCEVLPESVHLHPPPLHPKRQPQPRPEFSPQLMTRIAIRLGYLSDSNRYQRKIQRLVDKARFGGHLPDYQFWSLTPDKDFKQEPKSWSLFLTYQRCLKCLTPYPVQNDRPFCQQCQIEAGTDEALRMEVYRSNGEHPDWDKFAVKISDEERYNIRKRLAFMDGVPKMLRHPAKCNFCDNKSADIWWPGPAKCLSGERRICWSCVEAKYATAR